MCLSSSGRSPKQGKQAGKRKMSGGEDMSMGQACGMRIPDWAIHITFISVLGRTARQKQC